MRKRKIPSQLRHLVSRSVRHYLNATESLQRLVDMTIWIKGRCGDYVFQTSHGTQQIKLYEPQKYKNDRNPPLRARTRMIMQLTYQDPTPTLQEKLRYLYRTCPYFLQKDMPINLRLLNFYFNGNIRTGELIEIYRLTGNSEPDPGNDELYKSVEYSRKRTVQFAYQVTSEELFYAVVQRTGEISGILHFFWED